MLHAISMPPAPKLIGLQICLNVWLVIEILFADALLIAVASTIAAVIAARSVLVWWHVCPLPRGEWMKWRGRPGWAAPGLAFSFSW
jgi:hypothetical protein